jgi:hypothetical protein
MGRPQLRTGASPFRGRAQPVHHDRLRRACESLAREPARITTIHQLQLYDRALGIMEHEKVVMERAMVEQQRDGLVELRAEIAHLSW